MYGKEVEIIVKIRLRKFYFGSSHKCDGLSALLI